MDYSQSICNLTAGRANASFARAVLVLIGCTLVAAFTCRYRFVGTLGLLRFRLSNPLKAMAGSAVGALQIWCLLTPRLR